MYSRDTLGILQMHSTNLHYVCVHRQACIDLGCCVAADHAVDTFIIMQSREALSCRDVALHGW